MIDVLAEISSKTQLKFSYSNDNIEINELITADVADLLCNEALNKIFEPYSIKWTAIGNQIALKKIKSFSITGKLNDVDNQNPIEYAIVYLKNSNINSTSDYNGKFVLTKIPPGEYTLVAKAFGYATHEQQIVLSDKSLILELKLPSQSIQLNETIIVSDKIIEKTSVSEMQINQSQIESGKGISNDPLKTINSLPGISSNSNLYGPSNIYVRGGETFENQFLLDNIKLPFPFYFFGQSVINPEVLDKAEILTGGFGSNYGNSMSSVFNFSTKNGNNEHFKANADLSVFSTSALIEGPIIKNKLSFIIAARKSNFDVLFSKLLVKPPKMGDLTAKLAYQINSKNKLLLTNLMVGDKLDFLDSNIIFTGLYAKDKINAQNLQLQSIVSNKIYSKLSLLHSGLELNAGANDILYKIAFNSFGLREDLSFYPSPNVKVRAGVELNREEEISHEHEIYRSTDISITDTAALTQDRQVNQMNHYGAVYGAYEGSLFTRLKYIGGLRIDVNQLNAHIDLSPRMTIGYDLNSKSSVSANWGIYNQAPNNYQFIQKSSLKSNQCMHYILSYKYSFKPGLFFRMEGYYKDYKNLVIFDSLNAYSNSGYGNAKGAEFILMKETGRLNGWVSYAISKSERKRNLQTDIYPFFFDQRHTVNALISYSKKNKKRKWFQPTKYSLQFRYNTGAPYTPIVSADSIAGKLQFITGNINSLRNPAYNNLNAKIQWQRVIGKREKHLFIYYIDFWNLIASKNIINRIYQISSKGIISTQNTYTIPFIFNIGLRLQLNSIY